MIEAMKNFLNKNGSILVLLLIFSSCFIGCLYETKQENIVILTEEAAFTGSLLSEDSQYFYIVSHSAPFKLTSYDSFDQEIVVYIDHKPYKGILSGLNKDESLAIIKAKKE
jgi:hypothetical protein